MSIIRIAPGQSTIWQNRKCIIIMSFVATAALQYGLDYGMIGGLQAMKGFLEVFGERNPKSPIGWNLATVPQQLIASFMVMGAFLSSFTTGALGRFPRRINLVIACILCIISGAIMIPTTSLGVLYLGRIILGLSNGLFMTFSQIYIQETAPPHLRGVAFGIFQIFISTGSLLGAIVDNFTAKIDGKLCYQIPIAIMFAVPVLLCVGMFFVPESPRWLIGMGRPNDARKALINLRGSVSDDIAIVKELGEMQKAHDDQAAASKHKLAIMELFNADNRRRTFLCILVVLCQAASGSMWLIMYGTYFFTMAGVKNPFQMSVVKSCIGILGCALSLYMVRITPRRIILMTGGLCQAVFQLACAIAYQVEPGTARAGNILVAFSVLYHFIYCSTIAPYSWLVAGEIPSQRLRGYTFGIAAGLGFVGAWLITFTAPYFINPSALNWGPRYGYIWFGSNLCIVLFVFFFVPETKDRTLEELDEMFAMKVPPRQFSSYQCVATRMAGEEAVAKVLGLDEKQVVMHEEEIAEGRR